VTREKWCERSNGGPNLVAESSSIELDGELHSESVMAEESLTAYNNPTQLKRKVYIRMQWNLVKVANQELGVV
jgi:hypothetical protein